MIITQEIAEKYFGDEDPVGKMINSNNRHNFTVTGILSKVPKNTMFQFDILIPFDFLKEIGFYNENWGGNSILTMVQLNENSTVTAVNEKITEIRHRHVEEALRDNPQRLQLFNERPRTQFMLMPLLDIHLYGYGGYGRPMGAIQYVIIFTVIAIFILLIACINFMNLATARSTGRAKEVGLRKVVGARKGNLIGQFYGESILLSFIALIIAIALVLLLLPLFNTLSGKELSFSSLLNWKFITGMCLITILAGILSGSYPALFLSAFQPVKVLRGGLNAGAKSAMFRKILVVIQFSLSILLIIGTTVVYKQLLFMQTKNLGYEKEHVIYIPLRGNTRQLYQVLKEELTRDSRIMNASGSNDYPAIFGSNSGGADWEGKDPDLNVLISQNSVDFGYIETMKIEIIEGRSFSKEFATDTATAFVVNEEVVRIMGVESAPGKRFSFSGTDGTIVGVMKNFHFQTVQYEIEPLALYVRPDQVNYMVIRLSEGGIEESLDYVKSTWERMIPNYPFVYRFLDDDLNRMYQTESRLKTLLQAFTILAIAIACLGLFGLASFTAEQRTKEIGVRKVLGATIPAIVFLFSREFTKWVLVANVIAWPAAYFILRNWLQAYAYRTELTWWVFLGSGGLALLIALITVSYQSLRAALANPADALRYE
jgi:ABC-type antimicrobial peptide transport system permease subunit